MAIENFRRHKLDANRMPLSRKWQELSYLKKFIAVSGNDYLKKHQKIPEIILSDYKRYLVENPKEMQLELNDEERLQTIIELVDWNVNVKPKYRKRLKLLGITSREFGVMWGYSSPQSFHNSYKKIKIIRSMLDLMELHENKVFS